MEKREGGMREQSHIDAMREAVRGDIERAKERRPSIFERPAPPPVEIRQEPSAPPKPIAVPEPEPEPEPVTEPVPVAEAPAPKPKPRWAFWRR
jgi:hypothetical protein